MILKGIGILSALLALISGLLGAVWLIPVYFVGFFAALFLLTVLFCVAVCATVDLKKPVEKENSFYRAVMMPYVELLINLFMVKLETKGLEKTPREGRFLLVCNHQHLADPGILLHCFPKSQLTFISKKENRKLPIINKFMHAIRCQFIDRDNDRKALRGIVECIRMIRADEVSVGVFPEGYTSRDGKLHHFRPGVFKIAQKTGAPIVVCTINGTAPLFHNVIRLKRTPVALHLVDVIPPEDLVGKTTVEIAERVYDRMIADLGEDFRPEL